MSARARRLTDYRLLLFGRTRRFWSPRLWTPGQHNVFVMIRDYDPPRPVHHLCGRCGVICGSSGDYTLHPCRP